jgi:GT2 family glycosyltransferase
MPSPQRSSRRSTGSSDRARVSAAASVPSVGAVVVTQGTRPAELARCLNSLRRQREITLDVVVVGNGWQPSGLPDDVRGVSLPENVGPPAGRNAGVPAVAGSLLFFLDDDAALEDDTALARAARSFAASPRCGAAQFRIVDPDGSTQRRWVPRLRVGDPTRSGPAFALCEMAVMARREAFDAVGGWPGEFFFCHEGVDLTWRLWDAGWEVCYAADLVARHPRTPPTRHGDVFYRLNARNRVWVARRNLPAALVPMYLLLRGALTLARIAGDRAAVRVWLAGFVEGWRSDPGPRRPMRWRTVARLARLGQPPIV